MNHQLYFHCFWCLSCSRHGFCYVKPLSSCSFLTLANTRCKHRNLQQQDMRALLAQLEGDNTALTKTLQLWSWTRYRYISKFIHDKAVLPHYLMVLLKRAQKISSKINLIWYQSSKFKEWYQISFKVIRRVWDNTIRQSLQTTSTSRTALLSEQHCQFGFWCIPLLYDIIVICR